MAYYPIPFRDRFHPGPGPFPDHVLRLIHDLSTGIVVTDPNRPDNPIVYVNEGFTTMTGFRADEVIGCNCRFLQGPGSDMNTVALMRDLLRSRIPFTVELLNYRKDGAPLPVRLFVIPIFDPSGRLLYYAGIHHALSARPELPEP
ncbi:PAS domain-containing protein [Paenibacillus flagellatus]|uniref:PAS domain-containing protein n=1 Tax=Paenibacillus flagellatus TaxID=2211139 RepID=A0A2V5JZH4_9BACL|nr:PAS domain-containing protein [Paenibacillus flagellatus]PYI50724.1 hypothetical protein DLM86_28590 [Paenibacillus flagellatus]